MRALAISLVILALPIACSTQNQTSDPQITFDQMSKMLDDAQNATTVSAAGTDSSPIIAQARALRDDPNTAIYFADAPSPMGMVSNILAFDRLDFLGAGSDLWYKNIDLVRVFFLDNVSSATRVDILLVGISPRGSNGQFTYYGFTGSGHISGHKFEVDYTGGDGRPIQVTTGDLYKAGLAGTIGLDVHSQDDSGKPINLGKFPNLAGFK